MSNWNKMKVLLSTQFALATEYRAEIIIWMLSGTLSLVMMLVWMAQAAAAPGGQISGYTPAAFASYFLSLWMVMQLQVVWVAWELDFEIRHGTLSPKLLRPLDPMWQHYAGHIAERLVRFLPMLGLVVLFAWLSSADFTVQRWSYPVGLTLILLGFNVRFLWEYTIGLLAFWTDSSTSFGELVWLLYAALGGLFAPLAFYPEWAQGIARWTPFPYMLGLPAQLLTGKASLEQAAQGIGILTSWLVVFWFLRRGVWRAGLKKYGAVGA